MKYKVIERFLEGKYGEPSRCEDVIHVSDGFIAIIDGATAKHGASFEGGSPGRSMALAVDSALSKLPQDCDIESAIRGINEFIKSDTRLNLRRSSRRTSKDIPSAAVLILSVSREELWVVGDGSVRVDGTLKKFGKRLDTISGSYRSAVNRLAILEGKSPSQISQHDIGRKSILQLLKKQTVFQNNVEAGDLGYGMIDGSDECLSFAVVVDVSSARHIVLASDGYPEVLDSLAETEESLKAILDEDPLLIFKVQQTKGLAPGQVSFDDRAYIRVEKIS